MLRDECCRDPTQAAGQRCMVLIVVSVDVPGRQGLLQSGGDIAADIMHLQSIRSDIKKIAFMEIGRIHKPTIDPHTVPLPCAPDQLPRFRSDEAVQGTNVVVDEAYVAVARRADQRHRAVDGPDRGIGILSVQHEFPKWKSCRGSGSVGIHASVLKPRLGDDAEEMYRRGRAAKFTRIVRA